MIPANQRGRRQRPSGWQGKAMPHAEPQQRTDAGRGAAADMFPQRCLRQGGVGDIERGKSNQRLQDKILRLQMKTGMDLCAAILYIRATLAAGTPVG